MPQTDWYRRTDWSAEIEDQFFAKLRRARSQRDQYLVIQASTLAESRPKVCLRLIDHYFETKKGTFNDHGALLARAHAHLALNDLPTAIDCFKSVLDHEEERPNQLSMTVVELPYLIARREIRSEYEFALNLLLNHVGRLMFPIDHFRWQAACALIFSDQGLSQEARTHARHAIKAANIRKSGFRYHQDLGLVENGEADVVKAVYRIAA